MNRTRVVQPSQTPKPKPVYLLHHYHSWLPSLMPLKSPYQYRLHDTRHDVSALAQEAIVRATGNPYAKPMWTREEETGEQKNVYKHHVEMANWPRHITYEAPGHNSSVRQLAEIADGLRSGRIYFRRVSAAEVARHERALGLAHVEARRARNDAHQVRPLRPLDTRSLLKRKWTGIKTRNVVTPEEDVQAAIWPDDAAVARARAAEVDEVEQWED